VGGEKSRTPLKRKKTMKPFTQFQVKIQKRPRIGGFDVGKGLKNFGKGQSQKRFQGEGGRKENTNKNNVQ